MKEFFSKILALSLAFGLLQFETTKADFPSVNSPIPVFCHDVMAKLRRMDADISIKNEQLGGYEILEVFVDQTVSAGYVKYQVVDESTIYIAWVETAHFLRGIGITKLLAQKMLVKHPNVTKVTAKLGYTTLWQYEELKEQELDPFSALKQTAVFKVLTFAGFTNFRIIQNGDSDVRVEFSRHLN